MTRPLSLLLDLDLRLGERDLERPIILHFQSTKLTYILQFVIKLFRCFMYIGELHDNSVSTIYILGLQDVISMRCPAYRNPFLVCDIIVHIIWRRKKIQHTSFFARNVDSISSYTFHYQCCRFKLGDFL